MIFEALFSYLSSPIPTIAVDLFFFLTSAVGVEVAPPEAAVAVAAEDIPAAGTFSGERLLGNVSAKVMPTASNHREFYFSFAEILLAVLNIFC